MRGAAPASGKYLVLTAMIFAVAMMFVDQRTAPRLSR
jgi:hypothetical protein